MHIDSQIMLLSVTDVAKNLSLSRRPSPRLDGVSLELAAGEFTAVQGPSGSGKTTLLLLAGGLLAPDGGKVLIDGQNPYQLSSDARAHFRATEIGFVFQQFHLVPYLSVLDNVLAASIPTHLADARQRAAELLAQFGLEHRQHHVPGQLSVGERQRTALATGVIESAEADFGRRTDGQPGSGKRRGCAGALVGIRQCRRSGAAGDA